MEQSPRVALLPLKDDGVRRGRFPRRRKAAGAKALRRGMVGEVKKARKQAGASLWNTLLFEESIGKLLVSFCFSERVTCFCFYLRQFVWLQYCKWHLMSIGNQVQESRRKLNYSRWRENRDNEESKKNCCTYFGQLEIGGDSGTLCPMSSDFSSTIEYKNPPCCIPFFKKILKNVLES